ncbi:Eukaryotic translation initiation factor 3 subunit E [Entophlyctis sp. JEL0112]|nr:Eukaryotic translation initiation factor 3 subunit E [Entophlyctis sp. JEL0112]
MTSPDPDPASSHLLVSAIAPLLDRHLVYPLLVFVASKRIFPDPALLAAQYQLLKDTNMIDLANQVYAKINNNSSTKSSECEAKRPHVLATYERLQSQTESLRTALEDDATVVAYLKDGVASKNALRAYLESLPAVGLTDELLDALYEFAQCQFQIGSYAGAANVLRLYTSISVDVEKCSSAQWGKLACEILLENWDSAMDDLMRLKESIDTTVPTTPRANTQQLVQRTYFVAWSLFVFFNKAKSGTSSNPNSNSRDALIDAFLQPSYVSAIQTTCPWALRYLAACIVTTRNRRKPQMVKELVRLITAERETAKLRKLNSTVTSASTENAATGSTYDVTSDPLLQFIFTLYGEYNFSEAHKSLAKCARVLECDYFLSGMEAEFLETGRTMVFEATTLGLSREEGEKWVVDLVRGVRTDAKIDSERNTVVIGAQYTSVYQNVIERTRNLTFRTNLLASNIEKRETELATRRAATAVAVAASSSSTSASASGGIGGEAGTGGKKGGKSTAMVV